MKFNFSITFETSTKCCFIWSYSKYRGVLSFGSPVGYLLLCKRQRKKKNLVPLGGGGGGGGGVISQYNVLPSYFCLHMSGQC